MTKPLVLGALALFLLALPVQGAPASLSDCQPVRAVFYTSSDWYRLAEGLGANPSPCAQYYISIDPLVGDKTQMRPNVAWQVRALGPNFHALAEVNYNAWQNWVTQTGNSWYQAGVQARANMDNAGFAVGSGDTWALNELPSAVRSGVGPARQNVEQLLQGLYDGTGSDGQAQGVVFAVGVGQSGDSFLAYKASLESWFQDSAFWTEMAATVSDFFQEAYGDVRDYAVAGADPATRIGWLNAYLEAPLVLATAPNAPSSEAAARAFLSSAYGALANASWAWSSNYGWTQVGSDVMADYISAQTYAMRAAGASGRIGFAWNPLNSQGLSTSDFATDVGGILARLAGSIHETDGGDPTQACEATGCAASLPGAASVSGWESFASWTPTTAVFTNPPATWRAGTPSGPVTVDFETGGVATPLPVAETLTVSSSSSTGSFSSSPQGPWSPSLTLTISVATSSVTFYTLDSAAGAPTLTVDLAGALTTQGERIAGLPAPAAPPPPPPPPPPPAYVTAVAFTPQDGRMHVAARVVDGSGAGLEATVQLALLVGSSPVASTAAATSSQGWLGLTAQPFLERGCYTLRVSALHAAGHVWNGASPAQDYCVSSLPAHVSALAIGQLGGRLHVSLGVAGTAGEPVLGRLSFAIVRGSTAFAAASAATGPDGRLAVTASPWLEVGCYHLQVRALSAQGFSWDGASPTASTCVRSLPVHLAALALGRRGRHVHVALAVAGLSGAPLRALVSLRLLRGTVTVATSSVETGADGRLAVTFAAAAPTGCYRVRVEAISAPRSVWDRLTPANRLCLIVPRRAPRHRARAR